ncbi:MAG: murein hydrolase activator EnvC family protein, partial [Desulforhopalus sp.]
MGSVPENQHCHISRLLFAGVLLCLLVIDGGRILAKGVEKPDPDDEDVSSYTIKVRRLQKVISRQEDKIEEAKIEERNILEELEGLETRLVRQQERLESLTAQMAQQQGLIAQQEEELKVIRVAKDGVQNHLIKRINAYYTMGNIGLFNVTFSTKSLPELLSFYDAFDTLLQYDQDLLKTYQTSLKQVGRVKKALDLEKTVLEDFIHQTAAEKAQLEKTRQEKNALLNRIRVQATLHQRVMDEMLQTSEELSASI